MLCLVTAICAERVELRQIITYYLCCIYVIVYLCTIYYLTNLYNLSQEDVNGRKAKASSTYVLAEQGIVYTVTDVADLDNWMIQHFVEHSLFERFLDAELKDDPIVEKLFDRSKKGQKVTGNNGDKFLVVFKRISDTKNTIPSV